tara:strand:+ start:10526 stop:11056 length:531 start_codon:yes stop_codon:yes gene_type:complete
MMKVDLVILDVDGVLTDGRKYYDINGMPFAKTYCDKDFTAIKRMKGAGVKVCFLSGDDNINKPMAHNRNIDFFYARGKDKKDFIEIFQEKYNTTADKMVYIGDDLFDCSILSSVGHSFCPADACLNVKEICYPNNILTNPGGSNVVCELVELLLARGLIADCTFEDIENLDKMEVF